MINTDIKYSLDDVMIQPASHTRIRHREDIKSVYDDGYLPIFTAPMPCVVNANQYLTIILKPESIQLFLELKIWKKGLHLWNKWICS